MDRTSAANTIDLGGGKRGRRARNLVAGLSGTGLDPTYDNDLQEEVVAGLIEYAGLTPVAGARTQLRQALSRLFGGGLRPITGSATLGLDDAGLVAADCSGGAVTLTLPAANGLNGRPIRYDLVRTDSTANVLTMQRAGTDTIEGLTALALPVGARVSLGSDGSGTWRILAGFETLASPQLATPGLVAVPNGLRTPLRFQWGRNNVPAGGSPLTVTLPQAWSSGLLGAAAVDIGGICYGFGISAHGTNPLTQIIIYAPPYWPSGSGNSARSADAGCSWLVWGV